ncbi:hypothetical protein O1611_g78 [Lasiodiplodia mahajangana]|uniref:Uncharacterized protein n=1 Tax=Lasiodiplodia mahajangana TaxID=1108764 RepID=A0ACC2K189_9PEZI|nr:hypothetical protein O1611_g78 [Lasiodiplodia mahajangana]
MWLINTATLQLEQVSGPGNKRYAILSHTWEGDGKDEVSFQEFANLDMARNKAGFSKIEMTCQKATSLGLGYAWVDTCCIDKSSSAELSEAINSMFEWYKQSQVCFAYIADLPPVAKGDSPLHWLRQRQYRWFTRGWTLQELIAPRMLVFFDNTWNFRGDKSTLFSELSLKTGIDGLVLVESDRYLTKAPVALKMSWASARETTRVEDVAYCLLGIFDINMPLIYGEGVKAFIRLQEEIVKDHNDPTLFSWVSKSERENKSQSFRGILANSPSEFADCGEIKGFFELGLNPEFSLTNNRLRMEAKLALNESKDLILALECMILPVGPSPPRYLGIYLRKTGSGGDRTTVYIRKSVGTKETDEVLREQASRMYIRYFPTTPYYTIEDLTSSPDSFWFADGAYFTTMEHLLFPGAMLGTYQPPFTGFQSFNINYQGAHFHLETLRSIASQEYEAQEGQDREVDYLEFGPDIRDLPDARPGAEAGKRRYVVSVRVEGSNTELC